MSPRANGGEKLGAVSARVDQLIEAIRDSRAETRAWRDEVRGDITALRLEVTARMDKHEVADTGHHSDTLMRIERLEMETLDGAKMLVGRVESLEKGSVASVAVDQYKKWLIGTVVLAVGALLLNALSLFRIVGPAFVGGK